MHFINMLNLYLFWKNFRVFFIEFFLHPGGTIQTLFCLSQIIGTFLVFLFSSFSPGRTHTAVVI